MASENLDLESENLELESENLELESENLELELLCWWNLGLLLGGRQSEQCRSKVHIQRFGESEHFMHDIFQLRRLKAASVRRGTATARESENLRI